jgi:hypothetical protein
MIRPTSFYSGCPNRLLTIRPQGRVTTGFVFGEKRFFGTNSEKRMFLLKGMSRLRRETTMEMQKIGAPAFIVGVIIAILASLVTFDVVIVSGVQIVLIHKHLSKQ